MESQLEETKGDIDKGKTDLQIRLSLPQFCHALNEFFFCEFALSGSLELPSKKQYGPGAGIQLQVFQEANHALHPDFRRVVRV